MTINTRVYFRILSSVSFVVVVCFFCFSEAEVVIAIPNQYCYESRAFVAEIFSMPVFPSIIISTWDKVGIVDSEFQIFSFKRCIEFCPFSLFLLNISSNFLCFEVRSLKTDFKKFYFCSKVILQVMAQQQLLF